MRLVLLILLFSITSSIGLSQNTFSVSGKVMTTNNESIQNAIINTTTQVHFTNEKGEFKLDHKGLLLLKISHLGYEDVFDTLYVSENIVVNFIMTEISHDLHQVVIEEESQIHENVKTINTIEPQEIKLIPSASGVSDIFSALKTQPGVQSNTEGQKGLIVRGGNYDQITTYVDGIPVVGSSHLFGLLSMFQTDCIESVKLYNGYKPVKYGSALGPAIEINLMEAYSSSKKNTGSLKSSFISTQFQFQLKDENFYFQLGMRKSNLFLIQDLINQATNNNRSREITPIYDFSDVSFKATYLLEKQKVQFVYLNSIDGLDYNIDFVGEERKYLNTMSWGNEAASVKWNYYANGGPIVNAEVITNSYNALLYSNNRITFFDTDLNDQIWRNSISEFNNSIRNIKTTISLEKDLKNSSHFEVGLEYKHSKVNPNSFEYWEDSPLLDEEEFNGNTIVNTYSFYNEFSGSLGVNINYILGLRTSMFQYEEENEIHFNPRILVTSILNEKIKFDFYSGMSSQEIHLVTLNSFGFIPELWIAPSESKPVEKSWSTGCKLNYTGESTSFFIDTYVRGMSNLLEFSNNVDFNQSTSEIIENGITSNGQGAVVGLEISLKSGYNKFNYNVSYAYGRSSRLFDDLNQGQAFPFTFDIRNDVSMVLGYEINDRLSISSLYTHSSGRMLNVSNLVVPVGFTTPLGGAYSQWVTFNQPVNRNSYRLGNFNRLDLSISWTKKVKYGVYSFQLGAYNVTNRLNPYTAIIGNDEEGNQTIEEVGMIPILPNLTISFEWN